MKMMAEGRENSYSLLGSGQSESTKPPANDAADAAATGDRTASSEAIYGLLEAGETTRVTFCHEVGDAFEVSRLIASFANAEGGLIMFGAQPPHVVAGCNTHLVERMYEEARQYLEPEPLVSFHTLTVDGRPLAALRVGPSNALVLSAGGAFMRQGNTVVAMSANELTRRVAKYATALNAKQVAAKSAPGVQDLEPIVRATLMPLARAIVQQTEIIERLHDDLAAAARIESRAKEWITSAVVGAVVGQFMAMIFG